MVEVIPRVIPAGVVANPGLAIDVGRVRVAFLVAEIAIGLNGMGIDAGCRTASGDRRVSTTAGALGECGDRNNKQCRKS
jgi:hypothetical protein